jgi:hypothetical protein
MYVGSVMLDRREYMQLSHKDRILGPLEVEIAIAK